MYTQVDLATQIYDYVDKHIRTLDKDLKAFDIEIARDRAKLGLRDGETATDALNPKDKKLKRKDSFTGEWRRSSKQKRGC